MFGRHMDAGNIRLDKAFHGDAKHPNRNLSTTQSTCDQCGDGRIVYHSDRGGSQCQLCDAPL